MTDENGYPDDWHYQAELQAREADVAGRRHRLLELQGMAATHPDQLAAAENDVKVAQARLEELGGRRSASKRPAGAQKKTR